MSAYVLVLSANVLIAEQSYSYNTSYHISTWRKGSLGIKITLDSRGVKICINKTFLFRARK